MTDAEQDAHAKAKAAHTEAIHESWLAWKSASDAASAALHAAEAKAKADGPKLGGDRELQMAFDAYRGASSAALRAHRETCSAAADKFAAAMNAAR